MPTRQVDVAIRGKNEASGAFKGAKSDIQEFAKHVANLINPLNVLKGAIAGLGIATLGHLFKKATEAALEHEKALGRNTQQLNRLGAAWDYVLVKFGQALLGLGGGKGPTAGLTGILVSLGDWIDQHREPISFLADKLVTIAAALLNMGTYRAILFAATGGGSGLGPGGSGHAAPREWGAARSQSFDQFLKEQEEGRKRLEAEKLLDEQRKRYGADSDAMAKEREKFGDIRGSTRTGGYVPFGQVGVGGVGQVALSPIAQSSAPSIGTATKSVTEMTVAVSELHDAIDGVATGAIVGFADAWSEATQEMIHGSLKLGDAIVKAGRRAVGGVLVAKGQETLLDAAKAAVDGFSNPIEFLRAARLFAIGTAQLAAGALFSGGGGGGGGGGAGGLGSSGFTQQQNDSSRGEATLVIEGGLLDMSDPRQEQALARALESLSGRRVVIAKSG